jgi:signal transduction histidine kinase
VLNREAPILVEHLGAIATERFVRFSWAVVAEQLIELASSGVVVAALRVIAIAAIIASALASKPQRTAHLRLVLLWWVPTAGTLLTQMSTGVETGISAMFVELVCIALLVRSPSAIGSALVAMSCELLLIVFDPPNQLALYISILCTGMSFGVALQIVVRRSLVRAERTQLEAMIAGRELEHQVLELKQSEGERVRLEQQLFHTQRIQAIGTLAAGLAHDMNNVLGAITMAAQTLMLDASSDEIITLKRTIDTAARGGELTHGLLGYSQRGHYRKEMVSARVVVEEALALARQTRRDAISYRLELSDGELYCEGDRVRLGQVVLNLCTNAADAMDGSGTVVVQIELITLDDNAATAKDVSAGRYLLVSVRDTGTGMDEQTRQRVFEPFFTTKPARHGTGLGLSMVWGVVRAHAGAVEVESELRRGSTFRIYLPLGVMKPARVPTGMPAVVQRVLVVDDERAVRETTKRMLTRCGYDVITAEHGAQALELFAAAGSVIGLVVLDMKMPVMGGAECFRRLREQSDVPIIITTGYAVDHELQDLVRQGAIVLEKPYNAADLRAHLDRILGGGIVPIAAVSS